MSVTIGDQKFIKDPNKGWIDSKTKQPADTGLIKLLDSLMVEEPEAKKLRVKIDSSVEPVFINGDFGNISVGGVDAFQAIMVKLAF